MRTLGSVVLAIVLLSAGCDDVAEETGPVTFGNVPLIPALEVPVCGAAGGAASGEVTVVVAQDESSVMVEDLEFGGLSGPATAAHLHAGTRGVAGPVVFDIGENPPSRLSRSFNVADYPDPAPAGAPTDYKAFIRDVKAGHAYVNVHTVACPSGEIRGQLK